MTRVLQKIMSRLFGPGISISWDGKILYSPPPSVCSNFIPSLRIAQGLMTLKTLRVHNHNIHFGRERTNLKRKPSSLEIRKPFLAGKGSRDQNGWSKISCHFFSAILRRAIALCRAAWALANSYRSLASANRRSALSRAAFARMTSISVASSAAVASTVT